MRKVALMGVLLSAPQPLLAQNGVTHAVSSITAEDFIKRVGVIADDSMRGRDTPSPGLNMTAQYIADEFLRLGLSPGGPNGSFIQEYPLIRERVDIVASRVAIEGAGTLRFGQDISLVSGGPTDRTGASGPTVVVTGRPGNPQAVADLDVAGAVVFVVSSASTQWSRRDLQPLLQQRPAAVITVNSGSDAQWRSLVTRMNRVSLRTGWSERGRPSLAVRARAIERVLADQGFDLSSALRRNSRRLSSRRLTDLTLTIHVEYEVVEETAAPNVIAILPGSDPLLRDEYIAFSGHMDHVGVRSPVDGDSIFNGADDDASGTIAVLEAAEAFAMLNPRPRRSLMFVLVSGEEKGLWGSEYFAEHPPVPMDQIVANLNSDMVGRNWKDTIVAIGKEHSDLGETLNRVNERHPELGMTAIDDIWPGQNFYFRSDHYNFARKGVPILFFFNGTHDDYHRPSDEVDKIDGEKAARIVKLLFYLGLDIANADQRPRWYPESYRRIVTGTN